MDIPIFSETRENDRGFRRIPGLTFTSVMNCEPDVRPDCSHQRLSAGNMGQFTA